MPPKRKLDEGLAMPHKRNLLLNDGSTHTITGWESWKDNSNNPEWSATVPPELGGDYSSPLRNVSEASSQLATEILGTAMDEVEKLAISRTLRGSLCILRLDGENDDGEPRSVEAKLRLYAPHGPGKSIDFDYCYHHRVRMSSVEHLIYITAFVRTVEACGKLKHYESWTQGTTPVKLQQLENVILGREGVMSTSKLFKVLCAASTIGTWEEPSYILKENLSKITAKLGLAKEEAASIDDAILKFDDPGTSEHQDAREDATERAVGSSSSESNYNTSSILLRSIQIIPDSIDIHQSAGSDDRGY
ncbi:hypothetical protein FIBSPDRAFT_938029 [Athelia psychrophila]|uniref:Uncharacterized protein n=1 Tax=Athelia psychrophila TaxID=1759441 RepID=A0A165ZDZ5_9AGAM|nr:hypothetical protein FIBSPDRAFT_938029 [Fibularhizoctonia sp. CBS 109695]